MASPEDRSRRLFHQILGGIAAGVAVGLFVGEDIRPLGIVASGFIRLLQVNVLPYLLGSLIASLGSRGSDEMKLIARYGAGFLLLVWGLSLLFVIGAPFAFPRFSGTPVFGVSDAPAAIDWLDLYIPSNLFHALSNNLIPAVVLFGILAGVALGQMEAARKAVLLQSLEAFNEAMARVSRIILTLTPFGLFAIAAVTAGQLRPEEVLRLQLWLHFYIGGSILLAVAILPALVARFTPVPVARFLQSMRSVIITAAAAGDVLVVLPLIAESVKELLVEQGADGESTDRAVGVAVPLLYNFPHAGKVLSLAFLPFAAWFSGSSLRMSQLALLSTAGPLTMFGNINAAVPFLLDLLHLPADVFELFTVSSVLNSRFGAMVAASHTAALSILVSAAMLGMVRISVARILRFAGFTLAFVVAFVAGTRVIFTWVLPPPSSGLQTLSAFELRAPLVRAVVVPPVTPPTPPQPGMRLRDIRARGVLRVGYFADAVPWAFMNARGVLVGHDVEAAHRLAGQLGLELEFIRVARIAPAVDLAEGRIDILMTGFTATAQRAERMELSHPYSNEHIGFLVRDFDRRRFDTLASLDGGDGMVVAVPPIEGAEDFVKQMMPNAVTRVYPLVDDVIGDQSITAIVMPMERAYYWSRVHPDRAAVRPAEIRTATITVYAMAGGELELRNLVDLWIETRRASGEADEAYEYWIRGRALKVPVPRWSILRNVLGWQ